MNSNEWDWLAYLAALAIGLALIVWGLILIGLIWFLVSGCVAVYRHKKYLKEAGLDYRQVEDEVGAGLEADEVLQALWGAGVVTNDGYDNAFDWLSGTVFGVNLEETS